MMAVKRPPTFSTPDDQSNKASRIIYRDTPSPTNSESGSQRGSPLIFDSLSSESSSAKSNYDHRLDGGKILTSLHENLGVRGELEISEKFQMRCKVIDNPDDFDNISARYRYMFTTLDERARALEKQFHRIQKDMCELAGLSADDLTPVGLPSQDPVWVCGRICNDSSEGKLNALSVILEGSRKESSGRKIMLKLTELNGYSLFPGQIILVHGTNSTGREMVAQRIIEGVQRSHPKSSPTELLEFHHGSNNQAGSLNFPSFVSFLCAASTYLILFYHFISYHVIPCHIASFYITSYHQHFIYRSTESSSVQLYTHPSTYKPVYLPTYS